MPNKGEVFLLFLSLSTIFSCLSSRQLKRGSVLFIFFFFWGGEGGVRAVGEGRERQARRHWGVFELKLSVNHSNLRQVKLCPSDLRFCVPTNKLNPLQEGTPPRGRIEMDNGGLFLKRLWCCVSGGVVHKSLVLPV